MTQHGVATTYTCSPQRGWLNSVVTRKGTTTLASFTYTRDSVGRITAVVGDRTGESWTYVYDALDRLLSATNTSTPALSQSFTYDLAGNITYSSAVGSFSYPGAGPGAVRPHAVATAANWTFAYDDNGNQVSRLSGASHHGCDVGCYRDTTSAWQTHASRGRAQGATR